MGFFEGRRYFLIMGCELLIKKQIKSYKDLGVYTTAFSLAIKVHKFLVYSHASLIECLSQLQMIEELYEIKVKRSRHLRQSICISTFEIYRLYSFYGYLPQRYQA